MIKLSSKKRTSNIKIEIIKNFFEAEILNLSSKKPRAKIAEQLKKNIISSKLPLNNISLDRKPSLKKIKKK